MSGGYGGYGGNPNSPTAYGQGKKQTTNGVDDPLNDGYAASEGYYPGEGNENSQAAQDYRNAGWNPGGEWNPQQRTQQQPAQDAGSYTMGIGGTGLGGYQAPAGGWTGQRIGSVDYGAVGNLTALEGQNPNAHKQLAAQGLAPTINGWDPYGATSQADYESGALSAGVTPDGYTKVTHPGGGAPSLQSIPGKLYNPNGTVMTDSQARASVAANPNSQEGHARLQSMGWTPDQLRALGNGEQWAVNAANQAIGGGSGGAGGAGSAGGGLPGTGTGLEGQLEKGYGDLIGSGGRALSPFQESTLVNEAGDTQAQGEQDAIQSAREDAVRRGDTSGSSLGSREDQIRAQGAANQTTAEQGVRTNLRQEAANRLLGALSGGTNLYGQQLGNMENLRNYQLLAGQQGLGSLQTVLNLK